MCQITLLLNNYEKKIKCKKRVQGKNTKEKYHVSGK